MQILNKQMRQAPVHCFKMTDTGEESCCLSKYKGIIFYLSKFCLSWEFGEWQGGGRGGWGREKERGGEGSR